MNTRTRLHYYFYLIQPILCLWLSMFLKVWLLWIQDMNLCKFWGRIRGDNTDINMEFSYNSIGSYSFIYLSELWYALTLLLSIQKPFLHSCEVDLGDVSRQLIYALLYIWLIHVVHLADIGFNIINFFLFTSLPNTGVPISRMDTFYLKF